MPPSGQKPLRPDRAGDTTFAGYINERLTADIPTALRFATALVSLKMETPAPSPAPGRM